MFYTYILDNLDEFEREFVSARQDIKQMKELLEARY